ncbi:MAG: hypothetical protein WB424_18110, partial [Terracidiphilus sp.]
LFATPQRLKPEFVWALFGTAENHTLTIFSNLKTILQGAQGTGQTTGNRKQGKGNKEQEAGIRKQGAGNKE